MILVDQLTDHGPKGVWCHLVSDQSLRELHGFAGKMGIKRCWFQRDHYDLSPGKRMRAIQMGAEPVSAKDLVRRMYARRKIADSGR